MTAFDKDLDVRGLNCPLPILRAKKALAELGSGQVLRVLATDPGSVRDFQAFAKQTGNQLLSHDEADKVFTFFMKKRYPNFGFDRPSDRSLHPRFPDDS